MKKLFFIFTIIIYLLFINNNKVFADSYHTYTKFNNEEIMITSEEGNTYRFETDGNRNYRISLNSSLYLDLDILLNKEIFLVNTFESSSYIYLYGSIFKSDYNLNETIPYIIRVDKELDYYNYYLNSESYSNLNHFNSLIEFSEDMIVATLFYNGTFNFYYIGNYKLISFDRAFKEISSINLGVNEVSVSIYYDRLEVKDSYNNKTYFDREFNIEESPNDNEIINGYLELDTDCIVNNKEYEIGTIFTEPGYYILNDGVHPKKKILLKPVIEINGDKNDSGEYTDYINYKVSGGKLYINSNESYLNGVIKEPNNYSLLIVGVDNYKITYNFTIIPKLLTEINGEKEVGDSINFTGVGYLNGELIESGYTINKSGSYEFKLILDNKEISKYSFIVKDNLSEQQIDDSDNNNIIIYVLYSTLGVLSISLIYSVVKIIKNKIKRKCLKEEEKSK